ncbi:MAG: hypothetical protein K6G08_11320 [Prevotella sp.]|nr:hypothetical protein [Prevotella sp.]
MKNFKHFVASRMATMLLAMALCTLICACGSKATSAKDTADASNENDAPLPMFIMSSEDSEYMLMLYWAAIEEPEKTEDNADWYEESHKSWALQESFRSNAASYTELLTADGTVKVKFVDEVLKDPDGNTPSIGEIHGREDIPSLCARYAFADRDKDFNTPNLSIIVTESYLESHKRLDVKEVESEWDNPEPLPQAVVKKLEQKYGMKVQSSKTLCTIGTDGVWGKLQFEGEYKNAPQDKYDPDRKSSLALDVFVKGDEVLVNEEIGYYDPQWGASWNAEDDGEYVGCNVMAAFEGPQGIELCYRRYAPESVAVGMIYVRDDQLECLTYETYHWMVDEETPVWKSDIAKMEKMYHDSEMGDDDVKFTKWAHCYIDYENEWIWLRDKDEQNGAFFIRDDGEFKLIAVENVKFRPTRCEKDGVYYLKLAGPAGGPSWQQEIHAFKNGERLWKLNVLQVEGRIDGCSLNDEDISTEEGEAYLNQVPEGNEINAWFNNIEEQ